MRMSPRCLVVASLALGVAASPALFSRQAPVDPASAMHWWQIGPTRAGQAGRGAGGAAAAPTLQSASTVMLSAAMAMQVADIAPTAREVAACTTARKSAATVMARWTKLTTIDLAALNAKRKAAGQPAIVMQER